MEPNLVEPGDWRRGFSVTRQYISLVVDFATKSLKGYTELQIKPAPLPNSGTNIPTQLLTLQLHSRQCEIKRISVGGAEASYEIHDFLTRIVHGNFRDLKSYSALYAGDLEASERGELSIKVPPSVRSQQLTEIPVRIEYELRKPEGAVYFVDGCMDNTLSSEDEQFAHMFTHTDICGGNSIGGGSGARCWFPCLDTVQSRCPFQLEVTVDARHVAVSVGSLLDVLESDDGLTKTYYYLHSKPIAPHNVALAVGPFETYIDPQFPLATHFCLPGKLEQLKATTECIPQAAREFQTYLMNTQFPYRSYKQVFVDSSRCYDDASPYSTLAILSDQYLFRDDEAPDSGVEWRTRLLQARCLAFNYFGSLVPIVSPADAGLILGLTGLLASVYIRECIGKVEESEYIVECANRVKKTELRAAKCAEQRTQAGSMLGRTLIQPEPSRYPVDSELWAARGTSFNSSLAARCFVMMHMLEAKVTSEIFRKAICDFVLASKASLAQAFPEPASGTTEDTKEQAKVGEPTAAQTTSGIVLKLSFGGEAGASVKATTAKGESVVDPTLQLSEVSFMKKLRTLGGVHGQDINTTYVNQWLRHSGVPHLKAGVHYHRSGNKVEMAVKQVIGPHARRFQGTLQVKVVEDDGNWVHEKRVEATNAWMFPCHSQPARKKKGRKRKGENVEEQWRDTRNLQSAERLIGLVSGPRSLRVGRKSKYWTNESPVRYVMIDPRMCWLRQLEVTYSEDYMLLEMLEDKDKDAITDVIGQFFALDCLTRPRFVNPDTKKVDQSGERIDTVASVRVLAALAACLLNPRKPAVVRAEAATAIATWQNNHAPASVSSAPAAGIKPWIGAEVLETCFQKLFTENDTLLRNDFRVKGEATIKPSIARAFAMMQAEDGQPPPHAFRTIITMLRENDNSINPYSDGRYVAQVVKAAANVLSNAFIARQRTVVQSNANAGFSLEESKETMVTLIRQYLDYDSIAPSPQYVVTAACLQALGKLEGAGVIAAKTPFFAYAVLEDDLSASLTEVTQSSGKRNLEASSTPINEQIQVIRRHNWGFKVREAAFEAIVRTYLACRVVNGADWMGVFDWLLNAVLCEPSPLLRRKILVILLKAHADTVNDRHQELENHTSPSGAFWPVSNAPDSMGPEELLVARHAAGVLWQMINEHSAYDGRLRCLAHQLWRAIWGLETPPILFDLVTDRPELGPFKEWVDSYEVEKCTELADANTTVTFTKKPEDESPNRKRSLSTHDNSRVGNLKKLRLKKF